MPPKQPVTVADAQRDLQRALRLGTSTTDARAALETAQTAEAAAAQQAQARRAEALTIEQEVTAMVETAVAEIRAEIAAILPGFAVSVLIDTSAARRLIQERIAAANAEERRAAMAEELHALEARINDLEAQRAEIADRRRAGVRDDMADAGRVALIDMDLADLRPMAQAQQNAIAVLPMANVAQAEAGFRDAAAAARRAARLAVASELENRLMQVAKTLKAESPHGNIQHRYVMHQELAHVARMGGIF